MTDTAIDSNPLLAFPALPRFDLVRPEHVAPAVDTLLAAARATIERVATDASAPTWHTLVEPLADALDRLDRAWSAVTHLNAVVSTPALRDAYHETLPKVTAFHTDIGQDARLYQRYKALRDSRRMGTTDRRRTARYRQRAARLQAVGRGIARRAEGRFKAVQEELAELAAEFDDHVLDATNAWSLIVDDVALLDGVPADVIAEARTEAQADGKPGYKLTLRMPCYLPLMQYAHNRALRAALHRAYATRASELGADPAWDNTAIITRTLELRNEEARLLGYANYAEVSLVPKMAGSPAEVLAFLRDLAARAKPFAENDVRELAQFAATSLGLATLEPWDLAYASERLKTDRYAFSDQDVKAYFPEAKVVAGLFHVVETLYGVDIRAASAPAWHKDVRFFEIRDREGAIVGQFFMDNYARTGKQSGAWMDDPVNRRQLASGAAAPDRVPDVQFRRTHRRTPGAVHARRGEHAVPRVRPRPASAVDARRHARCVGIAGCRMGCRRAAQPVHGKLLLGMGRRARHERARRHRRAAAARAFRQDARREEFPERHGDGAATRGGAHRHAAAQRFRRRRQAALRVARGCRARRARRSQRDARRAYDRRLASFGHIFAGGYAAGYYSYKWAEVLSADAYSLFEETGVLSPATGSRFRDEVLARGGSRPALESFVAFRGRPPQIDALLRHNAMTMSS